MHYTHHSYPLHTIVSRINGFVRQHDDIPAVHAAFLVLTFLAAMVFNLGFFGVIVAVRMMVDYVKYRDYHGASVPRALYGVVCESLFDLLLFAVAMLAAVYLHHAVASAMLPGLGRAEWTVIRTVPIIVAKMHILEHNLHVIAHVRPYLHTPHPALHRGFSRMQWAYCTAILLGIGLLCAGPIVSSGLGQNVALILGRELVPWKL